MFSAIWNVCKSFFNRVKDPIKQWTKTATVTLAAGAVSDMTRSRQDLLIENAILRQQLIVPLNGRNLPAVTALD